jgi:hypothetical protein
MVARLQIVRFRKRPFTALGIIKYYEKRKDVLVLCPKKSRSHQ